MKPYEPPGYIGVVYATRLIAERSAPVRWGDASIPPEELSVWNSLFGISGNLDPNIIDIHLTAQVKKRAPEAVERYCDFLEARKELRDALCNGKLTASYRDENGSESVIPSYLWSSVVGDGMIAKGIGWFGDVFSDNEICRYIFLKIDEVTAIMDSYDKRTGAPAPHAPMPSRSGGAGRPTSMHLILNEAGRRCAAGDVPDSQAAFASDLSDWLRATHPAEPQNGMKSIQNNDAFRKLYREHKAARGTS